MTAGDPPSAPKTSNWSDLGVRTASAAVLIPLVLFAEWAGGVWFELLVLAMGLAVAWEWTQIVFPQRPVQVALHALAAVAGVLSGYFHAPLTGFAALIGLQVISLALAEKPLTLWRSVGVIYTGLPCLALLLLREDPQFGFVAVIWCFVLVWSADILAYFAGRLIGGPKLAPRISPKKTWAGLGGAVAGAVIASLAVSHFAGLTGAVLLAALAAVLAVAEQAGDLFESSLKRHYGVKDSGKLIPGHGGVLDRIDGLIAVVVIAALIGVLRAGPLTAATGLLNW